MERHFRDGLEDEVVFDQSQFGLLNCTADGGSPPPQNMQTKKLVSKWGNLTRTGALCLAYISLGLCMSVTGPTLLYLRDQVGTTMSQISYIFMARSAGTLGGSFVGGFVLDKFNPYSIFFLVIASMAIAVGSMPWCRQLWLLMGTSVIVGVGNGFLDTGASTLCLQLWGRESGPYMQAMHFAFAVGGSLAPLLVQAFIGETVAPNGTVSVRHPRSLTTADGNLTGADEVSVTEAFVVKAITEHSLQTVGTASIENDKNYLVRLSDPALPPTMAPNPSSTTTLTPSTEKPKPKPKPGKTDGSILPPSKVFEDKPLIQEPVKEPDSTTTTVSAVKVTNATDTTLAPLPITTAASTNNTVPHVSEPSATQTQIADVEPTRNPSSSPSPVESSEAKPIDKTNQLVIGNITSAEGSNANEPPLSSEPSQITLTPSTAATSSTEAPATTTTASTSSTSLSTTTTTTTTTTITTSATTTTTTTPLTASAHIPSTITDRLTDHSTVQPDTKATTAILTPEAPSTAAAVTSRPAEVTEVTVSRGKSRGQQDETVSTESPMSMTTTPLAPTAKPKPSTSTNETEDEVNKTPNAVYDWLERFGVKRVHMLYTVIAIIVLHTSFTFLFFLCSSSRQSVHFNTAERATSDRRVRPFRPNTKLVFVSLLFLFYLLYVGAEVVFAQFVTTFALESPLKLATSTANYVTTTFWAAFAAARFVAIFFAHFSNPTVMLIFNLCTTTIGAASLCIAGQTSVYVLYIGSALVGVGMASTFATGFVWTEQHILVTNRISAVFSIASSMGEMIFPTLTGALMEAHPVALMYAVLGTNLLCMLTFAAAWFLALPRRKNTSGYQLARQIEDETTTNY